MEHVHAAHGMIKSTLLQLQTLDYQADPVYQGSARLQNNCKSISLT
jgi:hypothetical protein